MMLVPVHPHLRSIGVSDFQRCDQVHICLEHNDSSYRER